MRCCSLMDRQSSQVIFNRNDLSAFLVWISSDKLRAFDAFQFFVKRKLYLFKRSKKVLFLAQTVTILIMIFIPLQFHELLSFKAVLALDVNRLALYCKCALCASTVAAAYGPRGLLWHNSPPPVYSLAAFPISDCERRLHLPAVSRVYFGGGSLRHFCFL